MTKVFNLEIQLSDSSTSKREHKTLQFFPTNFFSSSIYGMVKFEFEVDIDIQFSANLILLYSVTILICYSAIEPIHNLQLLFF